MTKDKAMESIQTQKLELENWQGGTEATLENAREFIQLVEDTVSGTPDSALYHNTFEEISRTLPSIIGNNRNNNSGFANQTNQFLKLLAPLSLPRGVASLKRVNSEQEQLIVELQETIEKARNDLKLYDEAAENQRAQHEEEMIKITRSHNEQLQFEVPLRTWVLAYKGYKTQGNWLMGWLISLTLIVSFLLTLLLLVTPDHVLLMFSADDKSAAVRWSFTFCILVGFLAFAIRAITRAMFSSFHLARDANERALLTKYYLGLIRKGVLEPEDRAIIMQSLFSRSDTGLLKDDGSPTMAGDLVAKVKSNS
ncbi:hypothetical protein GCM10008090_10050 [Arenicella chitinivorans]|uniref:DUF6161 domain-containing protein n=1 Tax=Arenicella chitinivorans TaxID=1329800 RepID=A0A918RM94_9GAMM|nr:DUF6161 domain-containing protein [Arenicella chitinivorans]GHA02635.1 hypothetical protein GCM10008090_10050 [Arenicella chitinivorans]